MYLERKQQTVSVQYGKAKNQRGFVGTSSTQFKTIQKLIKLELLFFLPFISV